MPNTKKPIEGDEIRRMRATEDDVEGHGGGKLRATEDDVEGHNIGIMNPMLARDLARARERDIQRETSRNSLISEAKRALRKR
jgi:hypothetical protein